jgi:luciferase family oxidoreductase group 1
MTAFSILDLAFIAEGSTAGEALRNSLELAQYAERWGFRRFWLAEHHNMLGVASAATAVAIGYVAGGTKSIRVGAGGVMLPNHAPLVIAEQFGTLESLYPGRIDLGLGRAPGTDQRTWRALRRDPSAAENFPQDVLELQALLGEGQPGQMIRAVPGAGLKVPLWILGSSLFGAELAAILGLPFAFASHFAPDALSPALELYRTRFQPSDQLARPYVMVGAAVAAASSDDEARRIFTTAQMQSVNMLRGARGPLRPPIEDIEAYWSPAEKAHVSQRFACAFVGSRATLRRSLSRFIAATEADEVMAVSAIYDHAARLRSYEILAEVVGDLAGAGAPA